MPPRFTSCLMRFPIEGERGPAALRASDRLGRTAATITANTAAVIRRRHRAEVIWFRDNLACSLCSARSELLQINIYSADPQFP